MIDGPGCVKVESGAVVKVESGRALGDAAWC